MNWKDVTATPTTRMLRQFGWLSLVVFGGWGGWRWLSGRTDLLTVVLLVAGLGMGLIGSIWPAALRPIFTGWMILAFPIGWVVSRVVLGAMFYLVFTPMAMIFRLMGRDALQLKPKPRPAGSHWETVKPADMKNYFRQS